MKTKIGIIIGSTRPSRVGVKVANWYLEQVKDTPDTEFEVVDIVDFDLPILDESIPASQGRYEKDHTKKWSKKIAEFDAYIWVTPEYNHSAPASLTNAISYIFKEWNRKPVGLVSYGSMGGVRAAEHLRQVAGELQMVDIRPAVMLMEPWAMFDESGSVKPEYIKGAPADAQIEDLLWWSGALQAKKLEASLSA